MSRYTTELRYLLENWNDEKLGLTSYPIFDESYREHLNSMIKEFYMFDEIGFETPARFARRLKATMELNMPYFNQFYLSTLEEIKPFLTMKYHIDSTSTLLDMLDSLKSATNDSNSEKVSNTSDMETGLTNSLSDGKNADSGQDSTSKVENSLSNVSADDTTNEMKNSTGIDGGVTEYNNDTYNHGLSVVSDTPEGFLETSVIGNDTYANNATKNRDETEKTGYDRNDNNYVHNDTNVIGNKKQDSDSQLTSASDNVMYGKESDSINNNISSNNISRDSSGTEKNVVNDLLNEIAKSVKNQNIDTDSDYEGFNGKTMSEMLMKWRESFINVDTMVIKSLEHLFLNVLN